VEAGAESRPGARSLYCRTKYRPFLRAFACVGMRRRALAGAAHSLAPESEKKTSMVCPVCVATFVLSPAVAGTFSLGVCGLVAARLARPPSSCVLPQKGMAGCASASTSPSPGRVVVAAFRDPKPEIARR
jgi:hypothetical protein